MKEQGCTVSTYLNEEYFKPISVKTEVIEVMIGVEDMFSGYAKGFLNEVQRINPLRASEVNLTPDELNEYIRFLVQMRVSVVNGESVKFYVLKQLWIPAFIQYGLCLIGRVEKRDAGIELVPLVERKQYDIDRMLEISNKIASFQSDVTVVNHAFPMEVGGDDELMSCALIAGNVRGMVKVSHSAVAYMSAFMGLKIRQESVYSLLYRVNYGDANEIQRLILHERGMFK